MMRGGSLWRAASDSLATCQPVQAVPKEITVRPIVKPAGTAQATPYSRRMIAVGTLAKTPPARASVHVVTRSRDNVVLGLMASDAVTGSLSRPNAIISATTTGISLTTPTPSGTTMINPTASAPTNSPLRGFQRSPREGARFDPARIATVKPADPPVVRSRASVAATLTGAVKNALRYTMAMTIAASAPSGILRFQSVVIFVPTLALTSVPATANPAITPTDSARCGRSRT